MKMQLSAQALMCGVLCGLCLVSVGCNLSKGLQRQGQKPPVTHGVATFPAETGEGKEVRTETAAAVVTGPPVSLGPPTEMRKVRLPDYIIEPPDVLVINATRVIPRPPYRIEPLDVILVTANNVLKDEPIAGPFTVEPDGTITLGLAYGKVAVTGLTIDEARQAIEKHLVATYKDPQVRVNLGQTQGKQQITGEHLVRPDGTISLGTYGSVAVSGMTIAQAEAVIESHLSRELLNPRVSVDVSAYNSKVYYIVTDGAGNGEQVYRLPIFGSETVLDAIGHINGLPLVANKRRIWIARPHPDGCGSCEVLPIDWKSITRCGTTGTNYQLFPGDRVFVKAECLITADTYLARVISPIERMLGITLLANTTVQSFNRQNGNNNNGGGFGF